MSKEEVEILQESLVEVFNNNSSKETRTILDLLLSSTEVKMIAKRVLVMYMIHRKESVDNIQKLAKVTRQSITRIAMQLQSYSDAEKKLLFSKLEKWEKRRFGKSLIKAILNTNISYATQVRKLKGIKAN